MGSVLKSPLFRHVFSMWPDPCAVHRFTYWLQGTLGQELDEYVPGRKESPNFLQLLKCLVELTQHLLEPVPTVEVFLGIFLECWNGEDYSEHIFRLLSYSSLQHFESLESLYLSPLKSLFVKKGLRFKHSLLCCLVDLLHYWGALEWPRYRKKVDAESANLRLSIFPDSVWNQDDDQLDFDPILSITLLARHVEDLLCIALVQERGHTLINHTAASFYEMVIALPNAYGVKPLLLMPHPQIVNMSVLSLEPSALSRILSCYISLQDNLTHTEKSRHSRVAINTFNSVVLDMCDSLWRDLAFASYERPYSVSTHLFTVSKEALTSHGFPSVSNQLSIIHHPALLGFVRGFFKETQGSNHFKFKPSAIWKQQKYKDAYLQFLQCKLLTGITSFILTFIKPES